MTSVTVAAADLDQIMEDIHSSFAANLSPGPGPDALDRADTWLETFVKITGPWRGEVALAALSDTARALSAAMLAISAAEVTNDDTVDALCELVNMIGGQVKGTLPAGSTMSLPLIRMMRKDRTQPVARNPHWIANRTFNWAGHPMRVTVTAAP